MTKIKIGLVFICLFVIAIQISNAQEKKFSCSSDSKNSATDSSSEETQSKNTNMKVYIKENILNMITILINITIVVILIFINRKSKIINTLLPKMEDLFKKLENLEEKLVIIKKMIEDNQTIRNLKEEIETRIETLTKDMQNILNNSLSITKPVPVSGYPTTSISLYSDDSQPNIYSIKSFYLSSYQQGGFKEQNNIIDKIYKCETLATDPDKAKFEINTEMDDNMKNTFFCAKDYNNNYVCKYVGNAAPGKNIRTQEKGILKHKGNGIWEPEKPVVIEFI